jgi:uncharacterized protein (TIGR02145 family)
MRYLLTSLFCVFTLFLSVYGQVPDYIPSDGLVAWYPFNGNANDELNPSDISEVDGAELSIDRFGLSDNAYYFDGYDDQIITNNYGPGGTGISLSFWYKTQQTTGNAYLISFGGGGWGTYFEIINNHWSSQTTGPCYGPALTGGGTLISRGNANFPNENIWHQCVVILPANAQSLNNVLFYFDGVLLNETCSFANYGAPAPNISTNTPIKFGSGYQDQGGVWSSLYEGLLDDIGIWNRALSEEEIQSIYLAEAPVSGCTDSTACNYDPEASSDDGSCIPSGCMDTDACNFNSEAECEGEACDYSCCPGPGCCSVGHYWDWELEQCFDINPTDTNLDGCTDLNDLMDILSAYGDCGAVETPWQCDEPLGYQGYDYATVSIGEQCWFAENLRTEQYSNGDPIPMIFENSEWLDTSEGARCWINNDSTYFGFPGFLYNGYVVDDSRGVCPQLWHVADDAEWIELEISHGLSEIEAHETGVRGVSIQLSQKMRVDVWGGINVLGFSAVRGGYRNWENGSFSGGIDSGAYWSNGSDLDGPGYREFHGPWDGVARDDIGISEGLSVRCIKD